jgi:hypothetical protein
MVPANSCKIPRVPHYSGIKLKKSLFLTYAAITLFGCSFQNILLNLTLCYCLTPRPQLSKPNWFRLFRVRSPLLTESLLFSLPLGTEMVHFPRLATLSSLKGSPIRKSAGQRLSASHRSLSQLTTSFIASKCLGIHRLPLVA